MQRYSAKMLSIFRAFIEIGIYDTEQYERSDFFYLELAPPIWSKNLSGNFKNAEDCCVCVCLCDDLFVAYAVQIFLLVVRFSFRLILRAFLFTFDKWILS